MPIPSEFRPELLSRRGEFVAWGTTLMTLLTWIILVKLDQLVHPALKLLTVILMLCSLVISLGNWMDRRTLIRVHPTEIEFRNGLRHVTIPWDQIEQVQVFSSGWGRKVHVLSKRTRFDFRTLGEVTIRGEVKGRLGFTDGEEILALLLRKSNLTLLDHPGPGYYYARH